MPDRFRGWVPLRLYWQGGEPWIDWCRLGSIRFTDPFFEMTVARCMQDPFAMLFRKQTPLSDLCQWHALRPGLRPSGFIFHMSRCGSTLISQMFAAVPRHVVISEGIPIDSILSLPAERATSEQRVEWLTSMVGALGQPRAGDESRYFIKFDAWHIRELPLIRKAFPDVPWIFLYRDPIEVLVSQVKKPGSWTLPGHLPPAVLGLEFADLPRIPRDEYCARVLALILQAAVRAMEDPVGGRHSRAISTMPSGLTITPIFPIPATTLFSVALKRSDVCGWIGSRTTFSSSISRSFPKPGVKGSARYSYKS